MFSSNQRFHQRADVSAMTFFLFQCLKFLFRPYTKSFVVVSTAPRELFVVFIIAFLTSFGSTGSSSIMVSYFSDEFNYSDVEASTLFACSAASYIIFGLFTGRLIDWIGLKKSFVVGAILGVIGSMTISLAWSREMLVFAVVFLLPLAMKFVVPVISIALKRLTYSENKRVSFAFSYIAGNIGAAFGYLYVDFVRFRFPTGVSFRSYSATSSRVIFMTGAASTLVCALFAMCWMRDIMVDEKGAIKEFSRNTNVTNEEVAQNNRIDKRWYLTFREPNFIRMVVLSVIMFPLLKVFTHFDVTLPKAAVREFGSAVLFGTIKAVNPIMITFLQLPVSDVFSYFHVYTMIIIGSTISALSVFIFCFPASNASWVTAFVIFTIGEMIFSHRVNDLATDYMPNGREGIYSSLMDIYLIAPRFIVDAFSGWLLSVYCPSVGERHCEIMWLIIGLMACVTPVALFPAKGYLMAGLSMHKQNQPTEDEERQNAVALEQIHNKKFVISDPTNDNDNATEIAKLEEELNK